MNTRDAVTLLSSAVPAGQTQRWADFGSGDGTFTRALVELLGPNSTVYAVDRDASALSSLPQRPSARGTRTVAVVADLAYPFDLPELRDELLDGAVLANALHFVRDTAAVLGTLASYVKPGGRVVIVEYDRRGPSRWVPYPIPLAELPTLATSAGLSYPVVVATRPSLYGGELYVAVAYRLAGGHSD